MSTSIEPLLLNEVDAAAALAVSKRTLYSLRKRKLDPVPFVPLGSRVMYDPRDLRDWIDRQKQSRDGGRGAK
jgi:predicted DNA-binding transcriptional regulator AlpA